MNPRFSRPISFLAPVVVASLSLISGDSQAAVTSLIGDHAVVPESGEAGNLSVTGSLSTDGDLLVKAGIDFGYSPAISSIASGISYFDVSRSVAFDITRADATFLWRDNVTSTADSKMSLDGNNLLTLFKSDGATTGIVLNPNTGAVTLAGSASGIYSSSGNPLLQFGSGGAVFSSAVTFQDGATFGSGGKLDASNVGYLKGVLGNLGYKESGGAGTLIKQVPLSSNIHTVNIASVNGFLYVTGNFSGSASIGGVGVSSQGLGIFVAKCNLAGQVQWINAFDALSDQLYALSIEVNPSGSCVIAGRISGTATQVGGGAQFQAAGVMDGFVMKLNTDGVIQWTKTVGGSGHYHGMKAVLDPAGNVYMTGSFGNTTTTLWGAGGSNKNISGSGAYDGYVVKFASLNGETLWARPLGGWSYEGSEGIAVDSAGDVVVAGTFEYQTQNLGGYNRTSAGIADAYVVKLAGTNGAIQWVTAVGSPTNDYGKCVSVDPDGDVLFSGIFSSTTTNLVGVSQLTNPGVQACFLAKLTGSSGDIEWARSLGVASGGEMSSLVVDDWGRAYVSGYYHGTINNLGAGHTITARGVTDLYLVAFASNGVVEFARSVGGPSVDTNARICLVGSEIFVAGDSSEPYSVGNTRTASRSFIIGWDGSQIYTPASLPSSSLSWSGGNATGNGSVALGGQALAGGSGSAAVGLGTTTGNQAFSAGSGSAFGDGSAAFGNGTWAGGAASAAFGQESRAGGNGSAAFGIGTRADAWASLALGSYNKGGGNPSLAVGTDPLLEVGNGTSTTATGNALTTLKNGQTTLVNKHWEAGSPMNIPSAPGASAGNALIVKGHTLLEGRVILAEPQGDISMGIYGDPL